MEELASLRTLRQEDSGGKNADLQYSELASEPLADWNRGIRI